VQALSHPGSFILEEEAKGSVHAMSLQTLLQHLLTHKKRNDSELVDCFLTILQLICDMMYSLVSACSPVDFDSPCGPSK